MKRYFFVSYTLNNGRQLGHTMVSLDELDDYMGLTATIADALKEQLNITDVIFTCINEIEVKEDNATSNNKANADSKE